MPDSELVRLRAYSASSGGRLYSGSLAGGLALTDPEQSLLVLGPPRSGKTSAVAVTNLLGAPGPVVATSTKMDLVAATLQARSAIGRCWLLDPTAAIRRDPPGVSRLRWSPVAAAATWDESLVMSRAMTGAARPQGRLGDSAHWTERAEALLAPLLHAAYLAGYDVEAVLRWTLRQDLQPAQSVLYSRGVDIAADVLAGIAATDAREQSGIWSSLAGVLAAYRSDAVLDNASPVNFDPATLPGTSDTVYVCSPARHQDLAAPIVVGFIEQVRSAFYRDAASGRRVPPVTLVLDEVANIAPLPDLPALVSEGGSQGVLTLACLQDLSQARVRWGPAAEGFMSLFGTKLILPGIGDLATLELVSRLGGEVNVAKRSTSSGPWWGPGWGAETVSWSTQRQRRIPIEAVSQQQPGTALLLSGARPPTTVRLPPWWAAAPFREACQLEPIQPRSPTLEL